MLLYQLCSVIIALGFIIYRALYHNRMERVGKDIPGPKRYPLVGNAHMFLGKPNEILRRLYRISLKYSRLVGIWIGPKLVVVLFDPKDIEVVLKDKRCMNKADEYRFLRPWLGDSILLSTGNKFRGNKKLMMPAFHNTALKSYISIFNEHARTLVQSLETELDKEEFDVSNYLYNTLLGELLETTLGVSRETLGAKNLIEYGKAVSQLCKIVHVRSYKVWLRFDLIFNRTKLRETQSNALNIVHPLTDRVIAQRKKELLTNQEIIFKHNFDQNQNENQDQDQDNSDNELIKKPMTLLDLLLSSTTMDGRKLTDQEIKDEILTVMFAGQDTTSVTIGFALSLLGWYHEIQDKVYAELLEVFGDSDRPATFEDLKRMEYLERVIQETWRLYPPIPLIARKANEDIPLETCVIPKGSSVVSITMALHRNPEYFEHPHRFNPDNFLPEKIKKRHAHSFLPFSAGIRTCIGARYATLNIKVLLSTLLRNYRVLSKRPQRTFKLVAETTLKRREGYLIGLTARSNAPLILHNQEQLKTKLFTDINCNDYTWTHS